MSEDLDFLKALIRIDSSTANGNETSVAKVIQAKLAENGIDSKLVNYAPGRDSLVADLNPDAPGPILGFTGHEDVVNPGDPAKWDHDPFEPYEDGDKLYGRGTADMKSGLAGLVLALIRLKKAGFPHHVRLLATVGEEYGAYGAKQLTEEGYADDLSALLVGEGGDKTIKTGHGGSYNYRIISHGKSVHSSQPSKGINAIQKLADFITEERHLFDDAPEYPALGPFVHTITIINGGKQINTIPDYAELRGNARPTPVFLNDEVTKRLQGLAEKLSNDGRPGTLEFKLIHSFIPVNDNPDSKAVNDLDAAIEAVRGVKLTREFTNGATDASEFVKSPTKFDIVWYGPTSDGPEKAHQLNEFVSIKRYEAAIDIYETFAKNYFA
ncbi:ArgE/DapE family deacylase [Lacticaseibacillus suibinensis]|uniref:ArgE/DapE family deacylase n=1 Tax=Lacticaseibacillus suibinensis TaxID=2486011 RepID=UPI000F76A34F|nr:ArgE/DapE family deacylase [Lacticaseibacillus suibinensis]